MIGFTLAGAMGAVAADPATRHRLLRNAGPDAFSAPPAR